MFGENPAAVSLRPRTRTLASLRAYDQDPIGISFGKKTVYSQSIPSDSWSLCFSVWPHWPIVSCLGFRWLHNPTFLRPVFLLLLQLLQPLPQPFPSETLAAVLCVVLSLSCMG